MKTRPCLSFLLLIVFILTACRPATTTPTTTEAAATPGGNGPETSASTQEVYPAPQQEQPQAETEPKPEVLYPGPQDGDEVKWTQAIAMILNGEVQQVTQAHSLQVTLMLKDGRTLITFEPAIDEVMRILAQCGDPCSDVTVATE